MNGSDPLVPALAGLVVDRLWWLESCGAAEADPARREQLLAFPVNCGLVEDQPT
ncbi:hypothetical protein GCM10029964_051620 [Kibdelosporangium lantanae]